MSASRLIKGRPFLVLNGIKYTNQILSLRDENRNEKKQSWPRTLNKAVVQSLPFVQMLTFVLTTLEKQEGFIWNLCR